MPDYGQVFLYNAEKWVGQGVCSKEKTDTDLFFSGDRSAEAKRLCARCPVTWECLEYAVRIDAIAGTWGGLNERERQVFLRQNRGRLDDKTKANHRRRMTELNRTTRRMA